MLADEMLYLLAKAIEQKSKSFLYYLELSRNISEDKNFQRVLIEMILQEQKHFEALSGMISRLLEGGKQAPAPGLIAKAADNEKKHRELEKDAFTVTRGTGNVNAVLLDQLIRTEKDLHKNDFESPEPIEEKKNIGNERAGSSDITEEKKLAKAVPLADNQITDNQITEKTVTPKGDNVTEKNPPRIPIHENSQEKEEDSSLKEGDPPKTSPNKITKENKVLIWTFGKK